MIMIANLKRKENCHWDDDRPDHHHGDKNHHVNHHDLDHKSCGC